MQIIQYDSKYNNSINEFICKILVEEFEYEQFREEVLTADNTKFIENGGVFWIAIDEEKNIIGTICLDVKEDSIAELKKLYVEKEYRSKGLAHDLFENVMLYARSNEIPTIKLGTYEKLESAIKFYLKKGFCETHRIDDEVYFALAVE